MTSMLRLATAALLCAAATPSLAQAVTYQIFNNSHRTLVQVFTAPASGTEWSENHLDDDILVPGRRIDMELAADDQSCAIKLLLIYEDGTEVTDTTDACSGRPYMLLRHG